MKKLLFLIAFIWLLSGVSWAAWDDGEIKTFVFQNTCDGTKPTSGIPAAYQCVDDTSASLSPQTTTIDGDSVVWGWDVLTGLVGGDNDGNCAGNDCIAGTYGSVFRYNNGSTQTTFQVTLPGTGIDYEVKLLVGNANGPTTNGPVNVQIFDNATEKQRIAHSSMTGTQFYDASDTPLSLASLQADITAQGSITYSATSTAFKVKLGSTTHDGSGGDWSPIAFLSIKRVGTTGTTTSTTTTTSTSTTTTTSTSTTTTTIAPGNYDLEVNAIMPTSGLVNNPWYVGQSNNITSSIFNQGSDNLTVAQAAPIYVDIFLCPSSVTFLYSCAGKITVATWPFYGGLLSGGASSYSPPGGTSASLPVGAAPGTYNMGAYVDKFNLVIETDDTDNKLQALGTVDIGTGSQFDQSYNMRGTSGFVTDLANQTSFTGQVYPNGLFPASIPARYFGMASATACATFVNGSDNTVTPELAGAMRKDNTAQCDSYYDIAGPGTYAIYLAMGSATSSNRSCVYLYNGTVTTTPFLSIDTTVTTGSLVDATGATRTFSNWKASQAGLNVSLPGSGTDPSAGNVIHMKIGCVTGLLPGQENEYTFMKHLRISSSSFVPPTTTTTTSTTSTTTTTTSTTTTTTTLPSSPYCPTSTFSWTPPTQYTSGASMSGAVAPDALVGYKIYVCDRGIQEGQQCDKNSPYLKRTYDHTSLTPTVVFNTFNALNQGIGVMGNLPDSSNQPYSVYVGNIIAYTGAAESVVDPANERRYNYATQCITGSTLPSTTTTTAPTTTTTSTSTTTTTGTVLGSGPDVRFNFPLNVVSQVISGGYIQMTIGQAYQVLVDLAYSDIGGSAASGTFDVLLYIDTISPANLLVTYPHPTMADNTTVQTTLSFNVPLTTNIGPGHYMVAVLSGISVDGNPNNNVSFTTPAINMNAAATTTTTTTTTTSTTATTLLVGKANYRNAIQPFVTGGISPLLVGQSYDIQFRVINDGTVDATVASTVRISLSEDQACDPQDTILGTQQINALLHEPTTVMPNSHMSVTIPPLSNPGFLATSYFICSVVDVYGNIDELDENNSDQALTSTASISVQLPTTPTTTTTSTTIPPFALILPRDDTHALPCELTYPATCSDSAVRGDIINKNAEIHFLSYGAAQQGAAIQGLQLQYYQFSQLPSPSAGRMPVWCADCIEASDPAAGGGGGTTCSVVGTRWKCQ